MRVREGFWNRLRNGIYEPCQAGGNADCTLTPVMGIVPSFIGGPAGAKAVGSALEAASEAASKAAGSVDEFVVAAKHLPDAAGRWAKFARGVDTRAAIQEALQSSKAIFRPNNVEGAFRIETNLGRVVGSKGETGLRIIVGNDGKIWTAFPIR